MNQFLKKKRDIVAWLKDMEVEGYTLKPNRTYGYVVDVSDDGLFK